MNSVWQFNGFLNVWSLLTATEETNLLDEKIYIACP